jgi:hypothetical protein
MSTPAGKAKPFLWPLLTVSWDGGRLHRVNLIQCTQSQPQTAIVRRFGSLLSESPPSAHALPGSGDEYGMTGGRVTAYRGRSRQLCAGWVLSTRI